MTFQGAITSFYIYYLYSCRECSNYCHVIREGGKALAFQINGYVILNLYTKRNAFFQVFVSTTKLCECVCVEAYPCLTTFFKNVITKMVKKGVTI